MYDRRSILTAAAGIGAGVFAASSTPKAVAQVAEQPHISEINGRDMTDRIQRALDAAASDSGTLFLPAGVYHIDTIRITKPVTLAGTRGLTQLICHSSNPAVIIENTNAVTLSGLSVKAAVQTGSQDLRNALIEANTVTGLMIEDCTIADTDRSGISLNGCSGRLIGNRISGHRHTGIFAINNRGLEIAGNHVLDIGDNGIQVWQSQKRPDGTLVANNRIERISAESGGNGQNGNGVNIYLAADVTVAGNKISDCRFSAIRNNSGTNGQIIANSCRNCDEVAIFVEFAFEGAVVSDNLIDGAATGISITNADQGGRLAVCANNLVRNIFGARANPDSVAVGIFAERDTALTGNVVEGAKRAGIVLGWGPFCQNLLASNNMVRDCSRGILASISEGAGNVLISTNMISGVKNGAIFGMDHAEQRTGDLTVAEASIPENLKLTGNLVTPA